MTTQAGEQGVDGYPDDPMMMTDDDWERLRQEREEYIEAQSARLLPCVKHGNPAAIEKGYEGESFILAVGCGCWYEDLGVWDSLEAAVDAWNERPVEDGLRATIASLTAQVATLEQQRRDERRMFEDLTPGGSEFHDSPRNVAHYLKERIGTVMRWVQKTKEAEAQVKTLEESLNTHKWLLEYLGKERDELQATVHEVRRQKDDAEGKVYALTQELAEFQARKADRTRWGYTEADHDN